MSEGIVLIGGTNQGAVAQGKNAVAIVTRQGEPLAPGDTVQLRSGSPLMTVTGVEGENCRCTWFRGKENNSAVFPAAALEKKVPCWDKK